MEKPNYLQFIEMLTENNFALRSRLSTKVQSLIGCNFFGISVWNSLKMNSRVLRGEGLIVEIDKTLFINKKVQSSETHGAQMEFHRLLHNKWRRISCTRA